MSDAPSWTTILGGSLLVPIGGALAWALGLFERRSSVREAKLNQWTAELQEKERRLDQGQTKYTELLEERLDTLERRETAREQIDAARDRQMNALRIAFDLVSSALRIADPHNIALGQAQQLLNIAFPVELGAPTDIIGMLRALETVPSTEAVP